MAKAYTPGLKVSASTTYRARRLLPVSGDVLVKSGDPVQARDVVARTFIEGDVTPVGMAALLSVPAGDVPGQMAIFCATFLVMAFVNVLGYALVASRARVAVGDPRVIGWINRTGGAALVGAGVASVALTRGSG